MLMRPLHFTLILAGLAFGSAAQAEGTNNAISDGLAALLGTAQQGGAAVGGTVAAPPVTTAAGLVDATSPQAIASLLQGAGYRAEVTVDNVKDPLIKSSAAGVDFSIYFYGCENNTNCQSIQFSSGYDLDRGSSFQAMNDWNAAQRFGYAYLDNESDPFVNMDINMASGISSDNFLDSLQLWEQVLSDFQTHIDW
jgi:hypothetical protein